MKRNSIYTRWSVNVMGVVVFIVFTLALIFSLFIRRIKYLKENADVRTTIVFLLYLIIGEFKEYFIVGFAIVLVMAFMDLCTEDQNG